MVFGKCFLFEKRDVAVVIRTFSEGNVALLNQGTYELFIICFLCPLLTCSEILVHWTDLEVVDLPYNWTWF